MQVSPFPLLLCIHIAHQCHTAYPRLLGPVVRIKQGLTKLKAECTEMDVQIGLLEHTLLDLQFKTKTAMRLQMSGGANNKKSKTLF